MARNFKVHVFAMEYPSYGISTNGRNTSERRINRDSQILYDYILNECKFSANDIILLGRSIGTGPAAKLAANNQVGGLALISPYTSICDLITHHVGRIPAALVFDRFPTKDEIINSTTKNILIVHGIYDEVIPHSHGVKLHKISQTPFEMVSLNNTHNDIFNNISTIGDHFVETFLTQDQPAVEKILELQDSIFVHP